MRLYKYHYNFVETPQGFRSVNLDKGEEDLSLLTLTQDLGKPGNTVAKALFPATVTHVSQCRQTRKQFL